MTSGTIMSTVHLNVGKTLQFHPIVEQQAFFPTINANGGCHGNCADLVVSCDIGCTDASACNYNENAIEDDGSCAYIVDEWRECGGNNESCGGCTNSESCNYDPAATVDDGSCIVGGVNLTLTLLTDNYPGETTWSVVDANGNTMAEGGPYSGQQTTYVEEFCVGGGCFDLIFNDSYGDGMQYGGVVGDYQLTGPDGNVLVQIVSGANFGSQAIDNFCVTSPAVLGCTNPEACNYDSSAGSGRRLMRSGHPGLLRQRRRRLRTILCPILLRFGDPCRNCAPGWRLQRRQQHHVPRCIGNRHRHRQQLQRRHRCR